MIKRGDRVRLTTREHIAGLPRGSVGTVLRDHDHGGEALTVSFDGFKGGHWADGLIAKGEPASAWYVIVRDIEVIGIPVMEETLNESRTHCETSVNETADGQVQDDVAGSRPAHASTDDAERHVHQGSQRRLGHDPERDRKRGGGVKL